ncbi:glycosyl hydrolase family 16 [Schizosaccharomyces cryophilus OY26]|uniref:Glycosyl hydrolase family 16 n=1 Tax=Schizosaccharomyces cryophilus (strain OY26 / ATCC MYA-4695 / CBS 11777 / NBRC 106824 / NRRL Y48691) TaxID=653667 RepID=S9W2F9_SCHCR|nr:glycosyl hydrolase family 16 [Schizosaccharomyces cryophilus OY26]EPY52210.1 glycosyl hydrolase family 16 [Schizosaccharomyces cryophilus OY26]
MLPATHYSQQSLSTDDLSSNLEKGGTYPQEYEPQTRKLNTDDENHDGIKKPWYQKHERKILVGIILFICILLIAVLGGVLGHRTHERHRHPSYKEKNYSLYKTYKGESFFDGFDFFNETDPTHGFVQYKNRDASEQMGLIHANSSNVIMAADSKSNYTNGRPSVRISTKEYFKNVLIIVDVLHAPTGCGTWPAFWTTGDNWPKDGEIDIMENVNTAQSNQVTLHTDKGCDMTGVKQVMTGKVLQSNCWVNAPGANNAGCGVGDTAEGSFGSSLNKKGGAIYAVDWRSEGIRAWVFNRTHIPSDITSNNPQPHNWPTPLADFPNTKCNIDKLFSQQKIIFDLTFCGDWAGSNSYNAAGCPSTCEDFVANHPGNFTEAYWDIRSLNVYEAK